MEIRISLAKLKICYNSNAESWRKHKHKYVETKRLYLDNVLIHVETHFD